MSNFWHTIKSNESGNNVTEVDVTEVLNLPNGCLINRMIRLPYSSECSMTSEFVADINWKPDDSKQDDFGNYIGEWVEAPGMKTDQTT